MKRELIKLGAISPQKLQLQKKGAVFPLKEMIGDETLGLKKIWQSPVQVGRFSLETLFTEAGYIGGGTGFLQRKDG